jgi:hypothetical protein
VLFKGFKAVYKTSPVTGLERLFYDRKQPFTKNVPLFQTHVSSSSVAIPKAYFVGGSNTEVISRLQANGIRMTVLLNDSIIPVTTNRVVKYESLKQPYEGHFLHNGTQISKEEDTLLIPRGTVMVSTQQPKSYFIVSVLEPAAEDSYFSWNFFDSYLQQKEYFSAYVFEDKAMELLEKDPALAQDFYSKKRTDPAFANNAWDQLFFIYKRSVYYEKTTANRLPIFQTHE